MQKVDIFQLEKPLIEILQLINAKKQLLQKNLSPGETPSSQDNNLLAEISTLEKEFDALASATFSNLTSYQIVQLSRHTKRPFTQDIILQLCSDFIELKGDRAFMDDPAIITGIGKFMGHSAVIIGHQRGRNTKENLYRNFGMARPEGYRKALRVMQLAEQFRLPILTFIDTPGASPMVEAEERGQSEAIAKNIMVMSKLTVPVIATVIGEGGSGGALAIGVANRVLMMENSIYSVISAEGCASILWKDGAAADRAAQALGLTAKIALHNGLIDEIIPEPIGGAQLRPELAVENLGQALLKHLNELSPLSAETLKQERINKYYKMSAYRQAEPISPFRTDVAPIKEWHEKWESVMEKSFSMTRKE